MVSAPRRSTLKKSVIDNNAGYDSYQSMQFALSKADVYFIIEQLFDGKMKENIYKQIERCNLIKNFIDKERFADFAKQFYSAEHFLENIFQLS